MMAAREGNTAVVVELIKAGANLDLQNMVCHLCTCRRYMMSWSDSLQWNLLTFVQSAFSLIQRLFFIGRVFINSRMLQ